jgi:hypothetical protein
MATHSLSTIVASVLAVYNITPPIDEDGKPGEVPIDMTSGVMS